MPIRVTLDRMLLERRMSLTELCDRVGITLANLSILKTGKAKAVRFTTLEALCRELDCQPGDLLQFEVKDPRVGMVTITEVEVSGDMSHAKIYYSAAEGTKELQKGLEKSAGFLRTQLSKRLLLRTVPQLHFVYDASIDRGMKLSKLIDEALAPDVPAKSDKH